MPDTAQLLLFITAGLVLNLTPGPDVMFIVANAVRGGVLYYRDPDHISLQGSQAVWDDMRRQNIIGAKP